MTSFPSLFWKQNKTRALFYGDPAKRQRETGEIQAAQEGASARLGRLQHGCRTSWLGFAVPLGLFYFIEQSQGPERWNALGRFAKEASSTLTGMWWCFYTQSKQWVWWDWCGLPWRKTRNPILVPSHTTCISHERPIDQRTILDGHFSSLLLILSSVQYLSLLHFSPTLGREEKDLFIQSIAWKIPDTTFWSSCCWLFIWGKSNFLICFY